MTAIIVSGHGQLSTGLLDAFEMIFGHDDKIIAVPFLKGEGIPQLQDKYQTVMDKFPDEPILFLVDVFGGTPYNSAVQLVFNNPLADVVTGVNLPMLLEIAAIKEFSDLDALKQQLKLINQEGFKIFSEVISAAKTTDPIDDEEDDLL
ncbi:mannose/fructose/sorbose PTS transporter subunit IIA [Lactococcus carnosus]|uniref:PTS fructose transporter subunit IIA n=1 Tax=Pseudolactococcus carnosus TaxID=2749961 RepID=A0ABT0ASL4_9LACT|nr:mannose/fructose/sorbose PTS transporter subunit IIA [Lactococcus carnosus]SCA91023.1 Fructose-specific phosphotransferase enzyme IIA component [Lactococcus piscium]MCJ1969568.1 PTS fructose transporter subunit IIA [Lactococcus carnosus]MCJ1972716.1 PTS fructose transporter subunit IIA [Lactococcus carnosus]MCJ1975149.1 PTS fructose transporter subunit IIA [Lactococcus carnosus]MCJ1981483.1 PTS fructose transporter subunit IIA [Lactococcus carnosus]